jgi:uncharacterized protein YdeI (YjbR/CyaY-like superfamily)
MKSGRVDTYIENAAPFARPILTHLRSLVHRACPDVQETVKWSMPHFEYKGILCGMAAFKRHCAFGFWKASLLDVGVKPGEGMGQFGRITTLADLPADKTIIRLVKEAVALNEKGVKAPKGKPAAKAPARTPADLLAALKKNRKALVAFEAFSPSHRREYIEWITEARTDQTRQRRLETAVKWMAEGKGRNWKYESEVRD